MRTDFQKRSENTTGFTLVEVILALAVVSLGIIAILGLLPVGLQSSRDAADSTLAATIVQDTFSNLRTNDFHNAYPCDTCTTLKDLATYDTSLAGGPVSNGYDQAGFSVGNKWGDAYYKVMLGYKPQTPLDMTCVIATVVWPAQSRAPINTNTFVTTIAQYR